MITITLPPELEQAMTEQASRQGTTPAVLALDKLNAFFLPAVSVEETVEGETMADYLKEFIGCIDSREVVPGAQICRSTQDVSLVRYLRRSIKKANCNANGHRSAPCSAG